MNLVAIYSEINRLYRYIEELKLSESLGNISGSIENIGDLSGALSNFSTFSGSLLDISGTIHHPTWGLNGIKGLSNIYNFGFDVSASVNHPDYGLNGNYGLQNIHGKADIASIKASSAVDDFLNHPNHGLTGSYGLINIHGKASSADTNASNAFLKADQVSGTVNHSDYGLNGTRGLAAIHGHAATGSSRAFDVSGTVHDSAKGLFKTYDRANEISGTVHHDTYGLFRTFNQASTGSSKTLEISGTVHHNTYGLLNTFNQASTGSSRAFDISGTVHDTNKGLFKTYDRAFDISGTIHNATYGLNAIVNHSTYGLAGTYGLQNIHIKANSADTNAASAVTQSSTAASKAGEISGTIHNNLYGLSALSSSIGNIKSSTDLLNSGAYTLSAIWQKAASASSSAASAATDAASAAIDAADASTYAAKLNLPTTYYLNIERFITYTYTTPVTSSFQATRNAEGVWVNASFTTNKIILFDDSPSKYSGFYTNAPDRVSTSGTAFANTCDCFVPRSTGIYEISWNIIAQLVGGNSPCFMYLTENFKSSPYYNLIFSIPIIGGTTTNYYSSSGLNKIKLIDAYQYSLVYAGSVITNIDLLDIKLKRLY